MKKWYQLLSFAEGISLLLLLVVAMPIKYLGGDPSWVKAVGPVHGFLFLAYVYASIMMAMSEKWSKKLLAFAIVSSSIPFGMILLERRLKRQGRR